MLANKGGFSSTTPSALFTRAREKGKESEVKKASLIFSNRAFPVGKKASFNFACPSKDCRDKVSSISRTFCVSSAPGRSGLLVKPGARDIRSLSALGSCEISLGDVFNDSVVHIASGFTSGGGCGGSPSRCDPKCGQREGAMARSEDDQLCTLSEVPVESSFDGVENASSTSGTAGVVAIADVAGPCAPVAAGFKGVRSALGVRDVYGEAALDSAGQMKGIVGLPAGIESDFSKNLADTTASDSVLVMGAIAGESERIIGLSRCSESAFSSLNSSRLGSLSSACARRVACRVAAALARVCPGSSSSAVSAAVARAHASTLHDACSNSWSDTVRVQGPTGRRCTKGGVSSPAEDLLPVSEVQSGVNFRPAGGARGQVAGSLRRMQPGTGTRQVKGRCGHTFPPPGGSWYPIRVTWIRIGHQAIDGLDKGVWNHTVGNLGAKG